MERNDLKEKINELITNVTNQETIEKYISRIEGSGMVDIESYEDNYLLPKIIVSAIFMELSRQYMPFTKKDQTLSKELYKYAL